jgi:hypothetical protein
MQVFASKNKKLQTLQVGLVLLALLVANFAVIVRAHAASYMTHGSLLEYNMVALGQGAFAVSFTAGAADGAGTLAINFGSWGGTVNTTQSVATTNCTTITGASTPLPGSLTAAGASSTVTISSVGALTSGTSYCAILTSATSLTNPAAGTYPVTFTDGTDTDTVEIDVISGDTVGVSATVSPTFTFGLSGTTATFASPLSSTVYTTTGNITATLSTNGQYGWYVAAEDSKAGLFSTAENKTIATVTPGTNTDMSTGAQEGHEDYALGVTSSTGTIAAAYTDATGHSGGGLSTSIFYPLATGTAAVSGATTVFNEIANVASTTPAAPDYADTITVVGAGSF